MSAGSVSQFWLMSGGSGHAGAVDGYFACLCEHQKVTLGRDRSAAGTKAGVKVPTDGNVK